MAQIIALSKATKNVLTATDPNDFIFHSSYNSFKILAQGTSTSQTVDSDPKTFTIAHGQSITPAFYAFVRFDDNKLSMPESFNYDFDNVWYAEVDGTNLYFTFSKVGANYNVDISFFLFEAPL